MSIRTRRTIGSVIALALVAGVFAVSPTTAAAASGVYEAEGEIIGMNPGATTTRATFVNLCDIPPNQGVDGYVFAIPPEFGAGSGTVEVVGEDLTGLHDLDLYFYTADCTALEGTLASEAQNETGPIPAGTAWIVVHQFSGLNTAVTLKATRPAGPPLIHVSLNPEVSFVKPGGKATLSGAVKGCQATSVQIYSQNDNGVFPLKELELKEGKFEFDVSPRITTRYVADVSDEGDCVATRSRAGWVKVQPRIGITEKKRCRSVAGRVTPNQAGSRIVLKKKTHGDWATVDSDVLDRGSRFRLEFPTCAGPYRLVWLSRGTNLSSTAREV